MRWLLAAFAWLYVLAAVVLPVGTLIWAALVNFITVDPALMAFDFRHFQYILSEYPKTWIALRNSLLLAVVSATLCCLLGVGIGWVVARRRGWVQKFLDQAAMIPLSVPSMVVALGLLWAYAGTWWMPVYGTIWILLIAYVTHYLPFGVRAASGGFRQLHPELEEAARVLGAGWLRALRTIAVPLLWPTLAASWTLVFVLALQEVSASILLYSSRSTVLSVAVFDLWEAGNVNGLAALSVMQLLVTFSALAVLSWSRRRGIAA
jgi:iron(III) transport system permease protein